MSADDAKLRLRLDLSYDGTEFCGWAPQPAQRSVAGVVQDALGVILRLDAPPTLFVAGRTDAGVHATGQTAHLDLAGEVDLPDLRRRLAGYLPDDVRVRAITIAPPGFDARFSALSRRYVYRVGDGISNPLRRWDTVTWPRPLDVTTMHEAAKGLLGRQDFTAYCKARPGATAIRTLHQLDVGRNGESIIEVAARADAFCHKQVRSMVGALIAVGEGREKVDWPVQVLKARVRDSLLPVAPPRGLTLIGVDYPGDDELAARATVTRRRRAAWEAAL